MPHRNFTGFDPSPFSDPQLDSVQPALLDEVAPEEKWSFRHGEIIQPATLATLFFHEKIMGQSMGKLKKYMGTSWEKNVKSHAKYGDL